MKVEPSVKNLFKLLSLLIGIGAFYYPVNAQCGVYLRPINTQQIPYSKVYLDRTADINNDGKADLMATQDISGTDSTRERILVLPGNGNGTFGTAITIDAPVTFDDNYTVAKINNDDLLDIVAFADYSTDPVSMLIYINNGNGTFTALPSVSASGRGRPIDFADLNGDGKTDYIGAMWNGGQIRYSLGNGDGTFAAAVPINSGGTGYAGDFNGDGKRDYASSDRNVYLNNGDLTFTTFDYGSMLQFNEVIWGVADLNVDGKSDLMIASLSATPSFAILTSTGSGFTRADYVITTDTTVQGNSSIGNFAGNSAPDIVFTYRYQDKKVVFVNDGAGNFTRHDLGQRFTRYNGLRALQADLDGDGKVDYVQANSAITNSRPMLSDMSSITVLKNVCSRPGQPRIVDIDGTGISHLSYWNPATGDSYIVATNNPSDQPTVVNWGLGSFGDIPTPGDFDGDGVTDRAVYRNSTGYWYIRRSSDLGWFVFKFGLPGDKPIAADFDGDTISDIAVFRPSDGNWYLWYMGTQQFSALHWGADGDKPVPADFDGDQKADVAVYRPSTGVWYVYKSSDANFIIAPWGISSDTPIPADFDGDGRADITVHRGSNGFAYILRSSNGAASYYQFGSPGDIVQVGDFDGDFVADLAMFRPSNNSWWLTVYPFQSVGTYGVAGAIPTSSILRVE